MHVVNISRGCLTMVHKLFASLPTDPLRPQGGSRLYAEHGMQAMPGGNCVAGLSARRCS